MPITRSKRKASLEDEASTKIKPCFVLLKKVKSNVCIQQKNSKLSPIISSQSKLSRQEEKSILISGQKSLDSKLSRQETIKINNNKNDDERNNANRLIQSGIKEINNASQFSQSSSTADVILAMKKIRKVLDGNFKNVKHRLQLQTLPNCLFDLRTCVSLHNSKFKLRKASSSDTYMANIYLSEDRIFQFINYVQHNLCGRKFFPGHATLINIIQEILKYNCNEAISQFSSSHILSELHNVFSSIINAFPPCHYKVEYLKLFEEGCRLDGFNFSEKKPILSSVLSLLYDQIYTKENPAIENASFSDNDFNKNFYIWDQKHHEKSTFKKLCREDRFERLFLSLDLLVRVLESDLAIFMIKYSHKLGSNVGNKMLKPLICSIIWQDYDSVIVVNDFIKQIIAIFVALNALNYPADKIKIVSRLVSLIINVINLYEYTDNTIEYPSYKNYSLDFSREIQKTIECSSYYSMELYIQVLESLRSPLLIMLLAHQLYSKINSTIGPISISVPLNAITNFDFQSLDDVKTGRGRKRNAEKFPVHDKNKTTLQFKISQRSYLKLLMIFAEAVNSYYRIQECLQEIKKDDDRVMMPFEVQSVDSDLKTFDLKKFKQQLSHIDLNEKVHLRAENLNYTNFIHVQLTKEMCIFYRNEVKSLSQFYKFFNQSQASLVVLNEFIKRLST